MNACSSETLTAARWYTGTPLAKAMSPTWPSDRPRTRNCSDSRETEPPAAATARASTSCDGARTMTAWPELRSMNSATPQSAADHDQVVGRVFHLRHQVAGDEHHAAFGGQ